MAVSYFDINIWHMDTITSARLFENGVYASKACIGVRPLFIPIQLPLSISLISKGHYQIQFNAIENVE
jgi:hypothetical protein